jgi:anti-sigma factor RsiW
MTDLPDEHGFPPETEADLAAFADGLLDPARRAEVEARLAAEPELAAALERQRVAVAATARAVEETSAPLALRAWVERLEAESARGGRLGRARRRAPGRRFGWLIPAVAATAAATLLIALVLPLGGALTVEDTLAAATRPVESPASPDPADAKLLSEQVDGVRFPNFEGKFGWRAVGDRADELDGRDSRTVFYELEGKRIAYTIVGGEQLEWPDVEPIVSDGVELRPFDEEGREAVTWLRGGQTCVLSGDGVPTSTLLELAAWKGQGSVKF